MQVIDVEVLEVLHQQPTRRAVVVAGPRGAQPVPAQRVAVVADALREVVVTPVVGISADTGRDRVAYAGHHRDGVAGGDRHNVVQILRHRLEAELGRGHRDGRVLRRGLSAAGRLETELEGRACRDGRRDEGRDGAVRAAQRYRRSADLSPLDRARRAGDLRPGQPHEVARGRRAAVARTHGEPATGGVAAAEVARGEQRGAEKRRGRGAEPAEQRLPPRVALRHDRPEVAIARCVGVDVAIRIAARQVSPVHPKAPQR